MTADSNQGTHPTTRNASGGAALVVMILSVAAVLYFGVGACQLYSLTCWPDRTSDAFELRAGVSGTWIVTWERDNGRDPLRPIWLVPPPYLEKPGAYGGADVFVRVDPPDAVVGASAGVRSEDWLPVSTFFPSDSRGYAGIDPRRVHRIDYRVDRVNSVIEGTHVRLFVPGNPDSEHPDLAPFFLGAAITIALLGFVPSFIVYRRSRSGGDGSSSA